MFHPARSSNRPTTFHPFFNKLTSFLDSFRFLQLSIVWVKGPEKFVNVVRTQGTGDSFFPFSPFLCPSFCAQGVNFFYA